RSKRDWSSDVCSSDLQRCDQGAVALHILLLQVSQQIAAAADHLQQTAAAVVIVGVLLQVLVQLIDVSGQQSDLHLGGAGVLLVEGDLGHNFLFVHLYLPLSMNSAVTRRWEPVLPLWAYSQRCAAVTWIV